ncbi:MAG TPA: HAMP domain-containing protein, partial [Acidimicrobiales bacterium]|nr:HAMP domain-containing protein [Acidimicrobiales bacterium]
MTLRLRLLLVLVGIVAAGLLATDVVIYNSLGSFLDGRVDQQLDSAAFRVNQALTTCAQVSQFGAAGGGPSLNCSQFVRLRPGDVSIPAGTFGELRDSSGAIVGQPAFFFSAAGGVPRLPGSLPGSDSSPVSTAQYFSARSTTGNPGHYRVLAQPVPGGGTLVVAIPLTDVDGTLSRLVWIEGLVTAAMLLALGSLSWWIVRRGLRPLGDMAETAGAIAAGDLSQRVPDVDARTEVGQLGVALNTMLGNIEQAFAARAASEERLRRFLADASHELR